MPPFATDAAGVVYHKGHVRAPNKDHLIFLSHRLHGHRLRAMSAMLSPPPTWDSVAKGWVGPIEDQKQCGSCWDFSGTGVVDIAYNKAGIFVPDGSHAFSEQYTLDCGRNGGCNGDDNTTVLDWAKKTGLPLTSEYGSYEARSDRCKINANETLYKIDDWGFADSSGGNGVTSVADIKAAIMQYGCVGAGIAADNAFSNIQGSQVFDSTTSREIDHDIILVGWDDSKGKNGAWKLRNSWDTKWADQGYCWIGYGINNVGTEAVWAVVHNANPPIDWGKI